MPERRTPAPRVQGSETAVVVGEGEISVQPEIREAIGAMEAGDRKRAADLIARYEQETVVQAVYERHPVAFEDMAELDKHLP